MPGDLLKKRKIAILGSRAAGKSSLVVQFVDDRFIEPYYPTIESHFSKSINHQGIEYNVDLIDTAGQDEYSILNAKHAVGIHGYLLVYSVVSRASFDMIQIIYDKIVGFTGATSIPCVIVAQKSDITARTVTKEEGQELAKKLNAVFIETSARNNTNVAKAFDLCLGEVERALHPPPPPKAGCIIM